MDKKKVFMMIVTASIFLGLFYISSEFENAYKSLKQLNMRVVIVAGVLQILTIMLVNYQWSYLSKTIKSKVSFMDIFDMNMVGTFVESITPSAKAGGEVSKVYVLTNKVGLSIPEATSLVTIQKINSMVAFVIINVASVIWFIFKVDLDRNTGMAMVLGLGLMILAIGASSFIVFSKRVSEGLLEKLPLKSEKREKLKDGLKSIRCNFKKSIEDRERFLTGFLMSFIIWSLFAVKAYIISRGIGIDVGFAPIAVVTFLTYMVGMVPLTPGGAGTFEASMVLFMTPLGVSFSESLLLALTLRFVTFWLVFIVSALYLGTKNLRQLILKRQRVC